MQRLMLHPGRPAFGSVLRPLLLILALAGGATAGEIVFDREKPLSDFVGFGVNCWPGDESLERHCRELKIRLARLWIGGKQPLPAEDTVAAYRAWWDTLPGAPSLRTTLALFQRHDVRVVAGMGAPPADWLEGKNRHLRVDRHGHFARLWTAAILHMVGLGGEPTAIELYNEPDGNWSVHVTPEENAAVIKAVRHELDAAGLGRVLIAGPGMSHCDGGPAGDRYANALDDEARRAVGIWSNHAWEWRVDRAPLAAQRSYLREHWSNVVQSYRRLDPTSAKPIYVTETGTKAETFHGRNWRTLVDGAPASATKCDAPAYAIRMVENALVLANGRANAVFFWEATDQPWSKECWGLLRQRKAGFSPRPGYEALRTFCPELPAHARVLTATASGTTLCAAAFAGDDRVVVVVANGGEAPADGMVRVRGAAGWSVTRAQQFVGGVRSEARLPWDAARGESLISLPVDALVSWVIQPKPLARQ